jgi:glucan-binding YG repeat protein
MKLLSPDKAEANDEEKGIMVSLKKDDDSVIANIITGKVRENEQRASGGQYVRIDDSDTVYLTDKNFKYVTKDSKGWLDKDLLDIKDEDIQKVIFKNLDGKKVYTIQREKKGEDAKLVNVPEGRKPNKSEISSVMRALSSLRIEDIENPNEEQTDKSKVDQMTFYLFNGKVYSLYPEKKFKNNEDVYCIRMEVAFQKPPEPEKKEEKPAETTDEITPVPEEKAETDADKEDADKKEEKTPEELAYEAKSDNIKMSPWTYVLAKWKYENFISNIEELLEEEKKKEDKEDKD